MKNKKNYWADTFSDCIVTKKDRYAPPERYFEAVKGTNDFYIDTFDLGSGLRIDFTWTEEERLHWNMLVNEHFIRHNVGSYRNPILIKRVYPPKIFDELLEECEDNEKLV